MEHLKQIEAERAQAFFQKRKQFAFQFMRWLFQYFKDTQPFQKSKKRVETISSITKVVFREFLQKLSTFLRQFFK